MNRYFVGVDLGATSGRVILATLCGEGIALEVLHRFPNRLLSIGGKYYWNIYSLYEEILHGLTLAGQRRIPVDSIGIDTWGVDMACVAADGTLAGLPRAYRDPYTNGVPEEFFRKIPRQEVYRRTGIQIMNFNSLFQLRAARGEGMSALENAASVLFMPDALSYLLTGEKVCEYTILSTSQFMDPRTREIDGALLREAGVDPALFPRVVMPGQRIGVLCDAVARQTGLGAVPVVAVAGHDTASAVAAVPARNEQVRERALRLPLVGDVVADGHRGAGADHYGGVLCDELHQRGRRGRHGAVPEEHHRHVAARTVPRGVEPPGQGV